MLLVVFVVEVSMPPGLSSVLLLLPEILLQLRMQIDVLLIAGVSCVRHKMSKPRRSRRLGKPLQQLQSRQCPVHVPVQRLLELQHFTVDSWILGLLPIRSRAQHEPQLTL